MVVSSGCYFLEFPPPWEKRWGWRDNCAPRHDSLSCLLDDKCCDASNLRRCVRRSKCERGERPEADHRWAREPVGGEHDRRKLVRPCLPLPWRRGREALEPEEPHDAQRGQLAEANVRALFHNTTRKLLRATLLARGRSVNGCVQAGDACGAVPDEGPRDGANERRRFQPAEWHVQALATRLLCELTRGGC